MKTIYKFELRRGRTMTIIFTSVCIGLIAMCMALYPMMKEMLAEMGNMFANMGEFSEMFSMEELNYSNAQDYYATECGMIIALCGAMLAAFLGGAVLGREESERTGEWLLTHPISRSKVFFGKFFSMITHIAIFNLCFAAVSAVSFPLINEPLNVKTFLLFFAAQFVMHLEVGCISLLLSAVTGRSAGPIGLGIAMVLYFLSLFAVSVEELEFLTYVTPFCYSDAATVFTEGCIDMVKMGIGLGIMLLCGISAHIVWCKKDIAA